MLDKNILSLIVIKLDFIDVLNLRATCKYFNRCIRGYKKYWFLKWLKRKYRFEKLEMMIEYGENKCPKNKFNIPNIDCIYPDYWALSHEEKNDFSTTVKNDPLYPQWKKEFREINNSEFYDEYEILLEKGYCNLKYCQKTFPNHVCDFDPHYSDEINEEYIKQTYPEIIHEKLLNIYDFQTNYFNEYLNYKPEHKRCDYCKKIYPLIGDVFNSNEFVWKKEIKEINYLCVYCMNKMESEGYFENTDYSSNEDVY